MLELLLLFRWTKAKDLNDSDEVEERSYNGDGDKIRQTFDEKVEERTVACGGRDRDRAAIKDGSGEAKSLVHELVAGIWLACY